MDLARKTELFHFISISGVHKKFSKAMFKATTFFKKNFDASEKPTNSPSAEILGFQKLRLLILV
jgi:hypothetical protein